MGFDVKTKRVRLINHRTFQPTPEDPIDFEATVERTLRDWCRQYQVKQIMFDPFQLQAVAQRLIKDRLPMQEFPQTVSEPHGRRSMPLRADQRRQSVTLPGPSTA